MNRISQPPIHRAIRPDETRGWAAGAAIALAGLLIFCFGLGRVTPVETVQGLTAREIQINLAMAHGGVKWISAVPPVAPSQEFVFPPWMPQPPSPPSSSQHGKALSPGLKIDVRAKAACPT